MLPVLDEKTPLDTDLVNGLAGGSLHVPDGQKLSLTFVGEEAGYLNTLGYYEISDDGSIGTTGIIFSSVDTGDLSAGDTVEVGPFSGDTEVGLFLIQDGDSLGVDLSSGSLAFEGSGGGAATVGDTSPPKLIHTSSSGDVTVIKSPVFHTQASLNPAGAEHVVSATDDDGSTLIAMEDVAFGANNYDGDFNDAVFDVSISEDDTSPVTTDETQTVTSDLVTLADGQEVALQITTESVTDDGTAELSGALSVSAFLASNFNIAFVIDRSGSTTNTLARDGNGNTIDLNNDGVSDRVLDAELAAFVKLSEELVADGLGGADVSVIMFDGSASIVDTVRLGEDSDGDGSSDVVEAIQSIVGRRGGTDFAEALTETADFFDLQPDVDTASNLVYFASDGKPENTSISELLDAAARLQDPNGIDATVNAFGIGSGSQQSSLDIIDNTGGSEIITDLSQLSVDVSGSSISADDVESLTIKVDGVSQFTFDGSEVTDSATGLEFGPVILTGLDPNSSSKVEVDAVVTTDTGEQHTLTVTTQIIGSGSTTSALNAANDSSGLVI
ncbi:MAG: DUF4114 domain-containing protein [Geminicoccaceae bacterium]|nr:DUF4114 domain-containing protein [Geminicoccaceae bacterium]